MGVAGGYWYLIHFPDGTESVYDIDGDLVQPGTEVLGRWIVDRPAKLFEREVYGAPVTYELWVDRKPDALLEDTRIAS